MRMRHFEDQWGHFFWEGGGNGFLENMFLLYVLPSFAIKNMKKIVIEQISKKVENL